jgi:uncharacterized protein (DUF58 family)
MLRLEAPDRSARTPQREIRWGTVLPTVVTAVGVAFAIAQVLLSAGAALELLLLAVSLLAFFSLLTGLVIRDRRLVRIERRMASIEVEVGELRELAVPPSLHFLIDSVREQGIEVSRGPDIIAFARPGAPARVEASVSALEGSLQRLGHHRLMNKLAGQLGYSNPWRRALP